ncbi:hypothetical protein JCM15765_21400 [Paradesulfitobacterium aromaticivorans]
MPYAILRFEKRRGGPASALEKHHERKKQQYASNPDIDGHIYLAVKRHGLTGTCQALYFFYKFITLFICNKF